MKGKTRYMKIYKISNNSDIRSGCFHMTNRDHMDLSYLDGIEQSDSGRKPIGLWASVGHQWLEWVISEEYEDKNWDYYWEVKVDFGGLVKIETQEEAQRFTDKYGTFIKGIYNAKNYKTLLYNFRCSCK